MGSLKLGLFSKYRGELMGIATIMIIICHMPANGVAMPSALSKLFQMGGIGCDIFLFLSGLGLSSSLAKSDMGEPVRKVGD